MAETKKIDIQQPQKPIEQVEQKFDRYSMGYTDRPINQRKQVNNVYLDGCIYNSYKEISTLDSDFIDSNVIYTDIGNLYFHNSKGFIIPKDGTYLINGYIVVSGVSDTSNGFILFSLGHRRTPDTIGLASTFIPWEATNNNYGGTITYTNSFKKGDEIDFGALNNTNLTRKITITITITKLS